MMDTTFADDIWFLTKEERVLIKGRKAEKRLGFAVLLKFFQHQGRFPSSITDIPSRAIEYLSEQLCIGSAKLAEYFTQTRAVKDHRRDIS
jgi:hypothetical protein